MAVTDFVRFLDTGVSSAGVARSIASRLQEAGFRRLAIGEPWHLTENDAFFVVYGGTVLAYRAGRLPPSDAGIVLLAAHTDSPGLRLKHRSARYVDGFVRVPVEVYGGPILATWLDRDLAVVGSVVVDDGGGSTRVVPIDTKRPLAIIPNLAIHLNRDVNAAATYNRQDHMQALFGLTGDASRGEPSATTWLFERLADHADFDPARVLDADLSVVPVETARLLGDGDRKLVVSQRIDNAAGCYTNAEALCDDATVDHGRMAVFFNHEEIGNASAVGAAGDFLRRSLTRIVRALDERREAVDRTLARTILISNDGAHAIHPNYADKHDAGYAPVVGGGPAIKKSVKMSYIGDLSVSGWFAAVCREADVPLQYLQNRSDIPTGSTVGPFVASRLAIRGLDLGIPMLAMHSARETAALIDIDYMIRALRTALTRDNREILDADTTR